MPACLLTKTYFRFKQFNRAKPIFVCRLVISRHVSSIANSSAIQLPGLSVARTLYEIDTKVLREARHLVFLYGDPTEVFGAEYDIEMVVE